MLLHTLDVIDVMATMMLLTLEEKKSKLATVSTSMAAIARSRFHDFKVWDGDTVVQAQRKFDQMVNECIIQVVAITKDDKTLALHTHPTDKWRTFMDVYATHDLLLTVDVIFRAMKAWRSVGTLERLERYRLFLRSFATE